MINATALNQSLVALISKKQELEKLDYNDERYDDVEEALHDLEDDFNEEFGDYLEEVLEDLHGDLKSDADVLLPTAYLPNKLPVDGSQFIPSAEDGVTLDTEKYAGKNTRLVLVPNPARFVLLVGKQQVEELWKA